MLNEEFLKEMNSKKRQALAFGTIITGTLWIAVIFKKNYRKFATLTTLHLLYQLIKEFEVEIMEGNVLSWIYVLSITASEYSKIGPFHEFASVSSILLIRQINPYLDVFFGKKTAIIRLVVIIFSYRYFKGKFFSTPEKIEDTKKIN